MARIENLVRNGRAKYTSGTVEVRRNIFPDPRGRYATGWSTELGDLSSTTDIPGLVTDAQRHTRTSDGAAALRRKVPTLAASTTYVVRCNVQASAVTSGFGLYLRPEVGGTTGQTIVVSNKTLQIGVTEFATIVTTSDTEVTNPGFAAVWSGGTIGDTIDMTAVLISRSTVMIDYFDGFVSNDPDLTPSWAGNMNASESVLTGQVPTGFRQDVNGCVYVSHDSEGNAVLATLQNGHGSDTVYSEIVNVTEGRWVGISGWIYNPDGATSVSVAFGRVQQNSSPYEMIAPTLITNSYMRAATSGFTYVSGAVQVTSYASYARVHLGTFNDIGARFMVRDMMVSVANTQAEALATVQTYFDGDSEPFHYGPTAQLVVPKWSGTAGQSSSYFDYEEPWTPNLIWDSQEDRTFELGVDRGIFYPKNGDGVPWNGLISVKEKLENAEPTMYYIDGLRYYVDLPVSEYGASIEAFTYPDEFLEYSGFMQYAPGMYYDEQPVETFGFSYRTKIGDGLYGPDIFYKIHLVYNAMAIPSERSYETINDSPDAATFSWDIVTLPASNSSDALDTAHIVIDSRKVTGSQLKALEDLLYGDGVNPPELPSPDEVQSIFE